MKLGLLGGSFDPIHLGHLRAAENAREALGLDEVLFVPAAVPPHKPQRRPLRGRATASPWCALATACAIRPSSPATSRCAATGPSYTVDTLLAIAAERPGDELFLIVGSDTLREMASWREPRADLRAVHGGGGRAARAERPRGAAPRPARGWSRVAGAGPAHLRHRGARARARGAERRYLVPDAVADYIDKRGLYR